MIIANFINKQDALVTGLDQYDYGQVLRIQGLKLPTAVEIHFGLEETGGTTTTRIGVTKDGVTDVPIPDSMLENGDTSLDYTIYAFIYLTDETSGKTTNKIKMQVKARSKPELLNKPEDKELFQKAIEAVNQSAKEAEGWAHGREDMPERATDNAKYYAGESAKSAESVKGVEQNVKDMVAAIGGIEQQVQDVKYYAGQAKTAAENALLSEQEAKKSEETSLQHRTGAETAENNAELAESNAKKSEQAVEQAKQLVMQMGQEVLNNKNQVAEKVEAFNKVVTDASDAIETAKTSSVWAVETAGAEQNKKVSDEGAKQVKAVEDKGNEVLQSIPKDFTTQMQSKLDKNQGTEHAGKALVVGEDGNVTVGEVQGGDGISIINTMSGESPLVVPDSAERVNKGFELSGNTEQVSTKGLNLFNYKDFVDVNTYQDKGFAYRRKYLQLKPNTAYRVTIFKNRMSPAGDTTVMFIGDKETYDNASANGIIAFFTSNEKKSATITTKESGQIVFKLNASSMSEPQEEYLSQADIIFSEGTTEIPYEPYTGGKPSPSPEYPQEIKNVGKWNPETQKYEVGVRVTGNNILNTQIEPDTKGTYQGWKVGDGKKKITLSIIDKGNNKDISNCYFGLSGNGTDQEDGVAWLIESGKITKTKTTSLNPYVTIFPSDETAQRKILERFDIQCEFGEIQTEYQPYKEQTITLTSDRPITKWDRLVEQNGQIGWLYKSQIIDRLDGKSNKVRLGEKKGEVQHFSIEFKNTPKGNGNADIYVDKYRAVPSSYAREEFGICCNWNDGIKFFSAPNINVTNTEEFKAWLSENPLTLEYETETPEFVPLPQSEQDAIRALMTYYPTTVITVDGGEVNPDIEVSYIADTKNYIDQKIAAIGKTVVETQKALL